MTAPPFLVGVASAFDLALFSMGLTGALRHRAPFNAAAAREIAAIRADAGDDVVFQIEVPAELTFVARVPRVLRRIVAAVVSRFSVELPCLAPPGTRFGIHLCYGDLANHSIVTGLADCSPAVILANSIVARWPSDTMLSYVHMPLAAGDEPPRLTASYYTPLSRLRLPPGTRLVAGFVHESLSERQLREVLTMIETAWGRKVDVAAACGLGRREASVARTIMRESRVLCETSTDPA